MLRRQVTGSSASFVCLRCRLQSAGAAGAGFLSTSGAGTRIANRSSRYFGSRPVSSLFALSRHTVLPLSSQRTHSRCYATDSSSGTKPNPEDEPEITTDNFFEVEVSEGKKSKKDPRILEPAPWELDPAEEEQNISPELSGEGTEQETQEDGQLLWDEDQVAGQNDNAFESTEKTSEWRKYKKPGEYVVNKNMYWPLTHFKDPKSWKSKGQHVEAERENLGLDMLGKPAAAIVLRKKPLKRLKRSTMEGEDLEPGQTSAVLRRLLEGGTDSLTTEQILLNIHELQPVDDRVLSEEEFSTLKDTLMRGFTVPQLSAYIETWNSARQFKDPAEKTTTATPAWILETRPWVPAIENPPLDMDGKLLGYIAQGAPRKEKLVMQLMRLCWDLSCSNVQEEQGHLDVKLRKAEFDLLTLGGQRWLKDIARTLLKDGTQIEMFPKSQYLSIRAPKSTADLILDRINEVLSRAKTVQFSASFITPEPLEIEPAVLAQIETMTSSIVRRSPSGDKFLVTWIQLPARDTVIENTGEQVLRLLSYAYRADPRASQSLVETPEASSKARFVPEVDCGPKLPWHERNKPWARWTAATNKVLANSTPTPNDDDVSHANSTPPPHTTTGMSSTENPIPTSIIAHPIEFKDRTKILPVNKADYSPDWSLHPKTDTTAVFGHVLFSSVSPATTTPPTPDLPRTFAPVLPCVRFLSLESNLKNPGLWHMITVLKFIPAPDIDPSLISSAPNLEVRIESDHREIKEIKELRAVVNSHDADLPLPESPADVRLHQTKYYDLPGIGIQKYAEPMFEFLKDSILKPWEGKLATPANLDGLRLPRRLLAGREGEEGEVEVDYMFAGLEIHRMIMSEWGGFRMRYMNVSGGFRRGVRSEVALDAVPVEVVRDEVGREEEEEEEERYVPAEEVLGEVGEEVDLVEAIDDALIIAEPLEKPQVREKDPEELTKEYLEAVGRFARGEVVVGEDGEVKMEGVKWFGDWVQGTEQ
ncbi:rmp1 protein [Cercophora samala]|uniref:Rmp1 protein n=1 Tax=Cercophora samala TaxID=330535 RepID=A0AA39ZFD9_9PEZI|nr:rmp1 protein [Cercophora samala]